MSQAGRHQLTGAGGAGSDQRGEVLSTSAPACPGNVHVSDAVFRLPSQRLGPFAVARVCVPCLIAWVSGVGRTVRGMTTKRVQRRRGPRPSRPVDLLALIGQAGTVTGEDAVGSLPSGSGSGSGSAGAGEIPNPAPMNPPSRTPTRGNPLDERPESPQVGDPAVRAFREVAARPARAAHR
jgi:hypothetical protein